MISSLWLCVSVFANAPSCDIDCQRFQAWASVADAKVPVTAINEFPDFLKDFIETLNQDYDPQNRFAFLDKVDQRHYIWKREGVGQLKATQVDGQVVIRFIPVARMDDNAAKPTYPLSLILTNLPLRCNEEKIKSSPVEDSSKQLQRYISKILIKKDRAVMIFDARDGDLTKETAQLENQVSWVRNPQRAAMKWIKATIQFPQLSDFVMGPTSASFQALLAVGALHLDKVLHPAKYLSQGIDYRPAIAAGIFSLVLCTMADSYLNFVERGHEELRRFIIGAFLTVPTWGMVHGWDSFSPMHSSWGTAAYTYFVIIFLGYLDRKTSKYMNEVTKTFDRFRLYQDRYPVIGLQGVAESLGKDRKEAGVKQTKAWRELMAIERFIPKIFTITSSETVGLSVLYTMGLIHKFWGQWRIEKELDKRQLVDNQVDQLRDVAIENAIQRQAILNSRFLRWIPGLKNIAGKISPFKYRCTDVLSGVAKMNEAKSNQDAR